MVISKKCSDKSGSDTSAISKAVYERIAMDLLEHNRITTNQVEDYISKKQDCCVINPCGSGKTFVMAAIIEHHTDKSVIILTKQSNADAYYKSKDNVFENVKIVTYNKLLRDFNAGKIDDYKSDIMLLDEAHYMGANKWFLPIGCIKTRFNPIMIGFTATPQRFMQQGTEETIATTYFGGNTAGNFTSKDLQDKGLFIEPKCIVSYYNLDSMIESRLSKIENSDLSDSKKNQLISTCAKIKSKWEKESTPEIILRKHIPDYLYKTDNNRILVYSSNLKTLPDNVDLINHIIQDMYPDKKVTSYIYTYRSHKNVFQEFLTDDDSYIKILFSIDKIMETIHIDDLNIVLMMRPSISDRIITQQYGRVNNISNKNESLIIDFVANIEHLGKTKNLPKSRHNTMAGDKKAAITLPNTKYIDRYTSLFDKIDKQLITSPGYDFDGLHGSLEFFSKVYDCDKEILHKHIANGLDIEDAIKLSKTNKKVNMTQNIIDKQHHVDGEKLNPNLSQDIILDITETFIKRHQITDEDMMQDLYLAALVSDCDNTVALSNMLNYKYTTWARCDRRHNALTHRYDDDLKDVLELETETTTLDMLECLTGNSVENKAINSMLRNDLEYCMNKRSTDRERKVLTLRFGLDDNAPQTLDQVGKEFGVLRERIRQIEAKAIRKLRTPTRRLKDYLCDNAKCKRYYYTSTGKTYWSENMRNPAWPQRITPKIRHLESEDISHITDVLFWYKQSRYGSVTNPAVINKIYKTMMWDLRHGVKKSPSSYIESLCNTKSDVVSKKDKTMVQPKDDTPKKKYTPGYNTSDDIPSWQNHMEKERITPHEIQ